VKVHDVARISHSTGTSYCNVHNNYTVWQNWLTQLIIQDLKLP